MSARVAMGRSTPQHIQQLVMREYCKQRNMTYLLAAVEYRMPGCTMILDSVIDDLQHLEGIVFYSVYQFPKSKHKRVKMYQQAIEKGCVLHTAVEGYVISSWGDVARIEDSILVEEVILGQSESDFNYLEKWEVQHAAD